MSKVKSLAGGLLALYFLFAVIGQFIERMGGVQCDCVPGCWCKRPILSTFRWVMPFGHRG